MSPVWNGASTSLVIPTMYYTRDWESYSGGPAGGTTAVMMVSPTLGVHRPHVNNLGTGRGLHLTFRASMGTPGTSALKIYGVELNLTEGTH